MIGPRTKICLVHCSSHELLNNFGVQAKVVEIVWTHHVSQRVSVVFQPKIVFQFHILDGHLWIYQREGLTDVGNCVFAFSNRSALVFEPSQKKVVPTFETECRMFFIYLKLFGIPILQSFPTDPSFYIF